MAANLGKLNIAITASTKGLQAAAKRTKGILSSLASTATSLPFIGGVAGGLGAVTGLVKVADAYEMTETRLTAFTGSATEAAKAGDAIFEMSQKTGTSYLQNAKALTRLQIAQKQTGLSTEENVQILGGLVTAMQMAGTESSEAGAAMLQLGQALASGELMGEELRSIRENAPLIAQAIADEFDVAIGGLKELGKNGELTSERVGAALLTMSEDMANNINALPVTAGKAFQRIVNSAGRVWDSISENTGFLDFIVVKLDEVAQWITDNEIILTQWAQKIGDYIKQWLPEFQSFLSIALTGLEKLINLVNYFFSQTEKAKKKRFESGIIEEFEPEKPNNIQGGQAALGGGIVNNFNSAVSKGFVVDVSEQQRRNLARL